MSNEIEDIKKRLRALEVAVAELSVGSLRTARIVGKELCKTAYEMFLPYQKGEQRREYEEFWKKKLESLDEEMEASKTILDVFEKGLNFREEVLDYVKATKVDTADKAMDIAHSFIKKYSPVALPLKAVKEGDVWLVDIDIGPLAVKVAKVKVDARTGDILSYEIPEKGSKEN